MSEQNNTDKKSYTLTFIPSRREKIILNFYVFEIKYEWEWEWKIKMHDVNFADVNFFSFFFHPLVTWHEGNSLP